MLQIKFPIILYLRIKFVTKKQPIHIYLYFIHQNNFNDFNYCIYAFACVKKKNGLVQKMLKAC